MAWIFALIVAAGIAWLWWWGMRPTMNELPHPGSLARKLRLLLSRGIHRAQVKATLTVCVRDHPEQRLIFTKVIDDAGQVGLNGTLLRESWTEPYYERFRAELERRGVPYREVTTSSTPSLVFELGQDFGGAYVVTRLLFEETVGVRIADDCVAFYRDVVLANAPNLTGVDSPDEGWGAH